MFNQELSQYMGCNVECEAVVGLDKHSLRTIVYTQLYTRPDCLQTKIRCYKLHLSCIHKDLKHNSTANIQSSLTCSMIGLPLRPNRCGIRENLTNIPPLQPEILIQPFPNLPLITRPFQRLSVTLRLHFRQRIARPLRPRLWQRPVAEMHERCFVEYRLRIPFAIWTQVGGVVCVPELGGQESVGPLRQDEGGGAEVVV
jgi:hypothetical protein